MPASRSKPTAGRYERKHRSDLPRHRAPVDRLQPYFRASARTPTAPSRPPSISTISYRQFRSNGCSIREWSSTTSSPPSAASKHQTSKSSPPVWIPRARHPSSSTTCCSPSAQLQVAQQAADEARELLRITQLRVRARHQDFPPRNYCPRPSSRRSNRMWSSPSTASTRRLLHSRSRSTSTRW